MPEKRPVWEAAIPASAAGAYNRLPSPRDRRKTMSSFCHWEGDTLVLNVLGRPRAKETALGKVIGQQLEIHVAEMPVRGRATAHMVTFLAGVFDVPEENIVVVFGVYNVNKQLRIRAPRRLPEMIPPPDQGSLF
jgi:uncharacterized protein YggU (UPF0235/DUF167 family)